MYGLVFPGPRWSCRVCGKTLQVLPGVLPRALSWKFQGNFFVRSRHCVSRRVALSHSSPRAPHVFSIFFYQSVSLCRSPAHSEDPCRRPDFWEKKSSFSSGFAVTRITPLRLRTACARHGSLSRGVLHGAHHTFCDCTHHCSPCGSKKKSAIS